MKTSFLFSPWRVIVPAPGDTFEVWTRFDETPGARNNYAVATGIQSESEAVLLAVAPELLAALEDCADWLSRKVRIDDQEKASFARELIAKVRGGGK